MREYFVSLRGESKRKNPVIARSRAFRVTSWQSKKISNSPPPL
ncbi:hypothetical protein ACWIUD_10495 [Helicobacter sp. 23-1044]